MSPLVPFKSILTFVLTEPSRYTMINFDIFGIICSGQAHWVHCVHVLNFVYDLLNAKMCCKNLVFTPKYTHE